MSKLISIIVNCYNGEKYLKQALESIQKQNYTNWELIFWDNQSTDNSKAIFDSFNESRFKYFYSEKFTSLYEARNLACGKCNGEFIAFLDCDDWWYDNFLFLEVVVNDGIPHSYLIMNVNKVYFSIKRHCNSKFN